MSERLRREFRLLLLIVGLLLTFAAFVVPMSMTHGQLGLVRFEGVGDIVIAMWLAAGLGIFIVYALDLIVRRRPAHPLAIMADEFRQRVLSSDLLVARVTVLVTIIGLGGLFTPAKIMIGHVRGFPFDHLLAEADRALFMGHDAWSITHGLFGGLWPSVILQIAYNLWFVLMSFAMIYILARPEKWTLRAHYLVAHILCWSLIGVVAATALASAGPCYFERAFGDPHFAPLMQRVHLLRSEMASIGLLPSQLSTIDVQNILWRSYIAHSAQFGGGISAMPSMHVSQATLMALAGRNIDRRLGAALWVFTGMVWIGSVHFGWHYAVDGIVGFILTLGVWRLAGWLIARLVAVETPCRSFAAVGEVLETANNGAAS